MRFVPVLVVCLLLLACDQKPTPVAAAPSATTPAAVPYQRFVPVPRQPDNVQGVPWSGAFALDTKTGNLCFTYGKGNFPKNWQGIPECFELFTDVPDSLATAPVAAPPAVPGASGNLPQGGGKSIDSDPNRKAIVSQFLDAAGGDTRKAAQMMRDAGWK
jgi:hypothetical protein